jgi:regulator of protease activity HflC (stomatin/prohibitin superfamily)
MRLPRARLERMAGTRKEVRMRARWIMMIALAVLGLLLSGCVKVLNDEGGVVTRYVIAKGIREKPLGPGLYLSIPSVWEVARYTVSETKYEMTKESDKGDTAGRDDIEIKTRDGQKVWVDVTIRYRLIFDKLATVHREFRRNYLETAVRPMARTLTAYAFGSLSSDEIYEGQMREKTGLEVRRMMNDGYDDVGGLMAHGIEILEVLYRSFEYTDEYQAAIELKRLASEQRLAAVELAKKKEADAEGDKLAVIKRAEGDAEATRTRADADLYEKQQTAKGAEALGLAEAKAKQALAEAMGGGQNIVALEFARNLSDKLQIWGIPTGAQSTSIMDLSGIFGNMIPRQQGPAAGKGGPAPAGSAGTHAEAPPAQ